MKTFKEWLCQKETNRLFSELLASCCSSEINEVLHLKNIDTNDPTTAKNKLINHMKKHYGDRQIQWHDVVDSIRHQFTNYDQEWRSYQKVSNDIMSKTIPVKFVNPITGQSSEFDLSDGCDRVSYWNLLTKTVADLVDFIIKMISNPKNQPEYLKANSDWLRSKQQRQLTSCH
jgi:hypothetical protein